MTTNHIGASTNRTCRICEQDFEHVVRRGTPPAYCSAACRRTATYRQRQEKRASLTELRCPRCGETKPVADFSATTQTYCLPCHAAYAREMRANWTPERLEYKRRWDVAYRHGVTIERLEALLEKQGRKCAICQVGLDEADSRKWHVDHDHGCCTGTSGKGTNAGDKRMRSCGKCIRGILCGKCNGGLGLFRDDPEIVAAALKYLRRSVRAAASRRS